MKGLSLSTYLGYPESLSDITPRVMDLKDAVEDATNADEFLAAARKFAPYGMHGDGWQIDRVTDSYVRLKGCDYCGNVEYLRAKFASRGVTSSMKKRAYDVEDAIASYLEELDDDELIAVWNEYCYSTNNYDDVIEGNDPDTLDEMLDGVDAWDIACKVFYGDWSAGREYVRFDGYANLETTDYPKEDWIYIGDIAREAVASDEDFNDDRIRALLDGADEEREASRKVSRRFAKRKAIGKRTLN